MRYAVEVDHPLKGWTRLQARYSTKKHARSWLPFIRKAWGNLRLRIVQVGEKPLPRGLVDGPVLLPEGVSYESALA